MSRLPRLILSRLLPAFVLLVLIVLTFVWHWNDRALLWWQEYRTPPEVRAQAVWLPEPMLLPWNYLSLWIGTALMCMTIIGVEMAWRCYRSESTWTTRLTILALEQFFPCLLAGLLITFVFFMYARDQLWMLPGLWAVLFSLGVFASCRLTWPSAFLSARSKLSCSVRSPPRGAGASCVLREPGAGWLLRGGVGCVCGCVERGVVG